MAAPRAPKPLFQGDVGVFRSSAHPTRICQPGAAAPRREKARPRWPAALAVAAAIAATLGLVVAR